MRRLRVEISSDLGAILVFEDLDGGDRRSYPLTRLLLDSSQINSSTEAKTELKEQLLLDYDFGMLHAIALDQQRRLEAELDTLQKSLYKKHRERLVEEGISDPKENRIKAEIVSDPEYVDAVDRKLEADKVVDIMKEVVKKMLEDRRIVLGKLAED